MAKWLLFELQVITEIYVSYGTALNHSKFLGDTQTLNDDAILNGNHTDIEYQCSSFDLNNVFGTTICHPKIFNMPWFSTNNVNKNKTRHKYNYPL